MTGKQTFLSAYFVCETVLERFRRGRSGVVHIVGTAHVSPNSRTRVVETIRENQPDAVAIELDENRFTRLWNSESYGLRRLLSANLSPGATVLAVLFSVQQRRTFRKMGIKPGEADMLPAARTAHEVGATLSLIDSESVQTFNRLAEETFSLDAVWSVKRRFDDEQERERIREAATELEAFDDEHGFADTSVSERIELLETMSLDEIERLLDVVGTLFPAQTRLFVTERNEYMAGRLHWLRKDGKDVVAVVGRAHVPELQTLLDAPEMIPDEHITEPRSVRFVTA